MRRNVWIYPAAWIALMAIYMGAMVANLVSPSLAARNAVANLLPPALLGIAILRLPAVVRWPAHLGRLVAFLVLSTAGWIALIAIDSLLFAGELKVNIHYRIVPFRLIIDLLLYSTLAGIAYAREFAERTAQAEALRARASLEAMRSQLHPHFIMNAFHAIVGLVRREPALAESALEQLGDLLRYSLRVHRDGIDEIPLRDELAFVESYLAIEQLRLGDRLRVVIDLPPATLDVLVPTFAIQILAENAIRHAIAPRAAGGSLHIHAKQVNGQLRVSVRDEVVGDAPRNDEGAGMGLRLLRERLAALYGNNATLMLRSVDGGTSAELTLPAEVRR